MRSTSSLPDRRGVQRAIWASALAVFLVCTGCFTNKHYTEYPKDLDGVFFNRVSDSIEGEFLAEQSFRNYYVFGLIPSSERDVHFTGHSLAQAGNVQQVDITRKQSFVNGLTEFAVALIPLLGLFRPFFWNPRSVTVRGRRYKS